MRTDSSTTLDASFEVVGGVDRPLSIVFESRGSGRNRDYAPALTLVLARLSTVRASLISVHLERAHNEDRPEAERIVVPEGLSFPIDLATVDDFEDLRRRISSAQAALGREPGATGPGNGTKRIRMTLGGLDIDPVQLRDILAGPVPRPRRVREVELLDSNGGAVNVLSSDPVFALMFPDSKVALAPAEQPFSSIKMPSGNYRGLQNGRIVVDLSKREFRYTVTMKGMKRPGDYSKFLWALVQNGQRHGVGSFEVTGTHPRDLGDDRYSRPTESYFRKHTSLERSGVVVREDVKPLKGERRFVIRISGLDFRVEGEESIRYHAIIANPDSYDIEEAVQTLETDTWGLPAGEVEVGDRIIVWKAKGSGEQRGIVAFGEVIQPFADRDEQLGSEPFYNGSPENFTRRRLVMRYDVPNGLPLWLGQDDHVDAVLNGLSVSRGQGTKLYKVTEEQWDAVRALAGAAPSGSSGSGATTVQSKAPAAPAMPVLREVPVEPGRQESYAVAAPLVTKREARRRESVLVEDFVKWASAEKGLECAAYEYRLPDGTRLKCDLFVEAEQLLIEAKADSSRESIRMAIGQLMDYRRFHGDGVRLAVLVPEQPSDDLLALLGEVGVKAWFRDGEGFGNT